MTDHDQDAGRVGVTPSLDPAAFAAWLRGREPDRYCGERRSALHCPLATYLGDTTGVLYSVSETYGPYERPYDEAPEEPLPYWAVRFIEQIDLGPTHDPVPASEALAILEVIHEH
jgi:hypothetical protein